ncbi:hypothetical protein C8Q80DRAFT_1163676 [Daedaleopsis nitida]|nr:hypothetical protein C8Q80DRAFT_1163676 [Daedaleopsis nitida]
MLEPEYGDTLQHRKHASHKLRVRVPNRNSEPSISVVWTTRTVVGRPTSTFSNHKDVFLCLLRMRPHPQNDPSIEIEVLSCHVKSPGTYPHLARPCVRDWQTDKSHPPSHTYPGGQPRVLISKHTTRSRLVPFCIEPSNSLSPSHSEYLQRGTRPSPTSGLKCRPEPLARPSASPQNSKLLVKVLEVPYVGRGPDQRRQKHVRHRPSGPASPESHTRKYCT